MNEGRIRSWAFASIIIVSVTIVSWIKYIPDPEGKWYSEQYKWGLVFEDDEIKELKLDEIHLIGRFKIKDIDGYKNITVYTNEKVMNMPLILVNSKKIRVFINNEWILLNQNS